MRKLLFASLEDDEKKTLPLQRILTYCFSPTYLECANAQIPKHIMNTSTLIYL